MNKNVTILSFSTRNNGNCAAISRFLEDHYKRTNVCSFVIDMQPCGNCDYECLTPGKSCPNVDSNQKEVMDRLCQSDLVYFIVPNYCGYPNGNYFAFNERKVGYFNMDRALMGKYQGIEKRFIIVSNTESEAFRSAMQQQTIGEPAMLYLKTGKYRKRSTDGDLLDAPEAIEDLKGFLQTAP